MTGEFSPATASVDLANILQRHGAAWLDSHCPPPRYHKVIRAITSCQTPGMGGQRQWCSACGYERYVYFSCRNRHCPGCQVFAKESWREARRRELLPVPYFHQVFTLPHQLNRLMFWSEKNQRALFKLLFDAVSQTLLKFGRQELGGKPGFTLVLHTWDQQLRTHVHLHCMIPSGALTDDGSRWIAGGSKFLFSVRAMSRVYRGKYLEGITTLLKQGLLDLPPEMSSLDERGRTKWLGRLRKHSWVVYSKAPFAGPEKLLDYLSRYTHRVAISNNRILSCENGEVRFSYRDRQDGGRKIASLAVDDFITRFMRHVLPDRFTRIRHYGFLACRNKKQALAQIRSILGVPVSPYDAPPTLEQWIRDVLGIELTNCPCCGNSLVVAIIPRMSPTTQSNKTALVSAPRPPP